MGRYLVQHRSFEFGTVTGEYVTENVTWSMRRSQPGEVTYEIPLSEPFLTSPSGGLEPEFGPYRTHWYLYRADTTGPFKLLNAGMITSVNLNKDRDTILIAGKDWLHYLQRRIYPFNPNTYAAGDWINWPVGWPHAAGTFTEIEDNPVDVVTIVQEMLARMQAVVLPDIPGVTGDTEPRGQMGITFNVPTSGLTTKYRILPGDSTTIFDHITKLSEQVDGFDFEITPLGREFKMYFPYRDTGFPVYTFFVATGNDQTDETFGALIGADWTNDGPDGTFLWGMGTVEHTVGHVWYYKPSVDKFSWLDKEYNFGELPNRDLIFQMLKDQNDLEPQEKLSLVLLNPEFMTLPFYGGDRPRSLLGNRVGFQHNWVPYRSVNNHYLVNAINCRTDQSTNEMVELELEIIYE